METPTDACPYCTLVAELEAQVATLRAALEALVAWLEGPTSDRDLLIARSLLIQARAALAEGGSK